MCSRDETAFWRVAEAIEELDAARKDTDSSHLEARIAAIWAMVGEMDPELARLTSRYADPPK